MPTAWIFLILAGFAEIAFTTAMKLSNGFTRPAWIVAFIVLAATSFGLLNKAIATIPLGTAYAVWTGIGAAGTAIVGMIHFGDPVSLPRVAFLALLIASIIGLKFAG